MNNTNNTAPLILPMTPDNYESFVALHNRVYPTRTRTVEEVIEADRTRGPKLAFGRQAAFIDDQMVGFAGYSQWTGETHQTWFQIDVVVDEPFRRKGIGTALYSHLSEEFLPHHPKVLRADAYENLPSGLPFAETLGFKDVFREGPSHLDLAPFDAASFEPLIDRLQSESVRFISYAELKKDAPDFADPLYAAYRAAWKDVPKEEESDITRNEWNEWVVDGSQLDFDVSTAALCNGEIVGFCEVGSAADGRPLYAGLAGVAKAERGRGIATALNVKVILAARGKGHPQIQTSSAIENIAMQTVYSRLGFVREPVWIQLEKRVAETRLS